MLANHWRNILSIYLNALLYEKLYSWLCTNITDQLQLLTAFFSFDVWAETSKEKKRSGHARLVTNQPSLIEIKLLLSVLNLSVYLASLQP